MRLLLEKMSVSEIVHETVEKYRDEIIDRLNHAQYEVSGYVNLVKFGKPLKYKHISMNISLEDTIIPLNIMVYDFDNQEECDKYCNNIEYMWGNFNEHDKVITLCYPSINGRYSIDDIITSLTHELEHAYQFVKSGQRYGINKLYRWAVHDLNPNDSTAAHILSQMIYYFNDKEISARIQEAYFQLRELKVQSLKDIKLSKVINEFFEMDAYLKRFLKRKDLVKDAIRILNQNDFDGKSAIRMIRAKRTLFKNKLFKMIGYYLINKNRKLTEDCYFLPIKNVLKVLNKKVI